MFPEIGKPKVEVINFIKKAYKAGHKIIIWTCRTDEYVEPMIVWLKRWGIPYHTINDNIDPVKYQCRKVLADIYLDDRALNVDDLEDFDIDTMSFKNNELTEDLEFLFTTIADNALYMEDFDTGKWESIMNKYGYELTEDLTIKKVDEQDE
jgi:hypothetical protein